VTIRLATRIDEPGVQAVIRAVYDEYGFTWDEASYHADLYDLDRHYFHQGDLFWVAAEGDQIVGTVALELFPELPGPVGEAIQFDGKVRVGGCDCSLERLYVHPSARGCGVGSKLIDTVLDEARRLGRTNLELWSDKRFGDAHRLYGRFGALLVGERICDDPDVSPEWGLVVRL
jgi:putative acetyltransferase